MPRIIETVVYGIDELSDHAKDAARSCYREVGLHDEWYDFVYEDFETICRILGVTLATTPVRLYGGGTRDKPQVYFTGYADNRNMSRSTLEALISPTAAPGLSAYSQALKERQERVSGPLQRSKVSVHELSEHYGTNPETVRKWCKRSSVEDAPMGPRERRSMLLSPEEKAMIVAFRKHTLLPLDDCLYALQATTLQLTITVADLGSEC